MRLARVDTPNGPRPAVQAADGWHIVDDLLAPDPVETGEVVALDARLLAPVEPRVVVGIAHNKALREHVLPIQAWLKSNRTVIGPGAPIAARRDLGQVNIEGELAVVIGRPAWRVSVEDAFDVVLGYTIANDVTSIDRVPIDERNFEPKAGRGYTPIGPWIETEVADPEAIDMLVRVNGELRAASNTARLQSTVAESIAYATSWLELGAGDVIMTGAPATFVPVEPGDLIELDFPGIGTLFNPVAEERS